MDGDRFDSLTRVFGSGRSRRGLLKALAGASLGAVAAAVGVDRAGAAARCRARGVVCSANADCCSSNCLPKDRTGRRYCAECGSPAQCPPATDACHTATCLGGACGVAVNPGFTLCNGICIDTTSDLANCGGCGARCAFAHAGATCSGGACSLGTCDAGYGNCDTTSENGCETDLTTVANCGDCGSVCSAPTNGTATCTAGSCGFTCDEGYTNCNGACVATASFQTDASNCGACGTVCHGDDCNAPLCNGGSCDTTTSNVGGSCDNGTGACDALGNCVPTGCPPGSTSCNGTCSNLNSDPSNCGSCGHVCGVLDCNTALCDGGSCTFTGTGNVGVPCHNATGTCDALGNCVAACASGLICGGKCCVNTGNGAFLCSGYPEQCTCYRSYDGGFTYTGYFC